MRASRRKRQTAPELFNGVAGLEEQADLLAALIRDGFRITAFREESLDLEDVFMQITKGEVS